MNRNFSITERLADILANQARQPLSNSAEKAARLCLLDTLGVGLYGSTQPEATMLLQAVGPLGAGGAAVWGTKERLEAGAAALVCGTLCHLRELDDVHYAILHTGCVCVPAALVAAQVENTTLGQLLCAVAVGVEATVRIALGMDYMDHRERGWHGTATCGAFGSAAAVGLLLGLDQKQLTDALGIAGSRTGGSWAFAADGSMSKRIHPGLAARDGLTAAYLARAGISGPRYILEAEDGGFYRLFSKAWEETRVLSPYESLAIEQVEFKWFASCKSVHAPLTAAMQIYQQNRDKQPEQIVRVTAEVNYSALRIAGRSYDETSVASAQISIPYGIALGLTGRSGQAEDYNLECLNDSQIRKLADKVAVVESEKFNTLRHTEHLSGARVTVEWDNGTTSAVTVTRPKGSIADPLTEENVIAKFLRLAGSALGKDRAQDLLKLVMEGQADTPISKLMSMLIPPENDGKR